MASQVLPFLDKAGNDNILLSTRSKPVAKDTGFADSLRDAEQAVQGQPRHSAEAPSVKARAMASNNVDKEASNKELRDDKGDSAALEENNTELKATIGDTADGVLPNESRILIKVPDPQTSALWADALGLDDAEQEGPLAVLDNLSGTLQSVLSDASTQDVDAMLPSGISLPLSSIIALIQTPSEAQAVGDAAGVANPNILKGVSSMSALADALQTKNALPNPQAAMLAVMDKSAVDQAAANPLALPSTLAGTLKPSVTTLDLSALVAEAMDNLEMLASQDKPLLPASVKDALLPPLPTATPAMATALKPQLAVMVPFQQPQWGQAVAERVAWMSSQGLQEADIHLDPPELGPIQVKVSLSNDQTHVSFIVQHASVREALDQSAMRLREMFDSAGLNLADVDVSDQSQQQATSDDSGENGAGFTAKGGIDGDEHSQGETAITSLSQAYSLVNTYA